MTPRKRLVFILRIAFSALELCAGVFQFSIGLLRTRTDLIARNLFLPKQLAFYEERKHAPEPRAIQTRALGAVHELPQAGGLHHCYE
jgi:hypothetical protein